VQKIRPFGSLSINSFLNVSFIWDTYFSNFSLCFGSTTITAFASAGIELCFNPPLKEDNLTSNKSVAFQRTLVSTLTAFALPALISIPECPPFNPSTQIL